MLIPILALLMAGCGLQQPEPQPTPEDETLVENVSVPESFVVSVGDRVRIGGEGYMIDDEIIFDTEKDQFRKKLTDCGRDFAEFEITGDFVDNEPYDLTLARDYDEQYLGKTMFIISKPIEPEKYNVIGTVTCAGEPLEGVGVSDGVVWAYTDANGEFKFYSEKTYGYVYFVNPVGYEYQLRQGVPMFWESMGSSNPEYLEEFAFRVNRADNDSHVVALTADWHMANRVGDTSILAQTYMKEVGNCSTMFGMPLYELALGDLSWDSFWYSNSFYLASWRSLISNVQHPIFPTMGNHDFDFKEKNHMDGAKRYREALGPMFYSFNIGQVHYMMINSIYYRNSDGTTSGRNPKEYISENQIEWFREDLSHVSKDTPIIIGGHAPFNYLGVNSTTGGWMINQLIPNGADFLSLLSDYEQVYIVDGHRHVHNWMDLTAYGRSYAHNKMVEITVPALSGSMWITSSQHLPNVGYMITYDGIIMPYDYFICRGKNIEWGMKSIGYDADYKMRAYDMNKVKEYWNNDPKIAKLVADAYPQETTKHCYDFTTLYGVYEPNSLLVNVFCGDPTSAVYQ
ncbi:MAG: calcineurin-like phosphoesterase C-terminal domain-containing protein, partial [Bacteroidales bacterium]|nr:calcineurin-like phosphoesterase C-terminal domain-containing protein [Bacteroidales bacterium]